MTVCILSFLEHGRNIGPSTLLTTYLFFTISSNIINTGLRYVAWNLCSIWGLPTALFASRIVLFILESQTKHSILRAPFKEPSLEKTSGFFGVLFFWWVNKVLKMGYSRALSLADMPPLDKSLDAVRIREAMQRQWDKKITYNFGPMSSYKRLVLTDYRKESGSACSDAGSVAVLLATQHLRLRSSRPLHRAAVLPTSAYRPCH